MTVCLLNVFIGVLAVGWRPEFIFGGKQSVRSKPPTFGCFLPELFGVENIALHQNALSSSETTRALKAVDGNRNTHYYDGDSCNHANGENAWWRVDLGALSEVHSVSITNRGDCCADRLRNFTIAMSQTLADDQISLQDPSLCFHYHANPLGWGATVNFPCPGPVYARYVKIQIHLANAELNLCEVEVFGSRPAPPFPSCPTYTFVPGRKSPSMVLLRISVSFIIHCASECNGRKHCYSMNIKQEDDTWICELLEDVRELNGTDVIAESGWRYFRVLM